MSTIKPTAYYGWAALGIAALAMVATLPGRTQGLGLVTAPLLEDLHLTQLEFAGVNLVATLVGASFALPAGWLIDRAGVGVGMFACELALGLTVLAMARIETFAALAVTLTLTRGLGQTSLSIASLATVGKWFSRRLSLAMGVYSLVLGFGFIAAFPGVQYAVERYGWRPAWGAVGYALVGASLLSLLVLRRAPDRQHAELEHGAQAGAPRQSHTLREALSTPSFWVYGLTSALYLFIASATSLLNELILRDRGLGADTFRAALATTAIVGILANFVGGFLGARGSLPRLLAIATALLVPSLAAYPFIHASWHAIVWAAAMGAAGGIVTVVFFTIWGAVYGPLHLGKIQGVAQGLTVLGSAVGPVAFAASADRLHSYTPAFLGLVPIVALAAAACWFVKAPGRPMARGA